MSPGARPRLYLAESVHIVFLQKSIPAQIRQLILYISNDKGEVDGYVRETTCSKQVYKSFLGDKPPRPTHPPNAPRPASSPPPLSPQPTWGLGFIVFRV